MGASGAMGVAGQSMLGDARGGGSGTGNLASFQAERAWGGLGAQGTSGLAFSDLSPQQRGEFTSMFDRSGPAPGSIEIGDKARHMLNPKGSR